MGRGRTSRDGRHRRRRDRPRHPRRSRRGRLRDRGIRRATGPVDRHRLRRGGAGARRAARARLPAGMPGAAGRTARRHHPGHERPSRVAGRSRGRLRQRGTRGVARDRVPATARPVRPGAPPPPATGAADVRRACASRGRRDGGDPVRRSRDPQDGARGACAGVPACGGGAGSFGRVSGRRAAGRRHPPRRGLRRHLARERLPGSRFAACAGADRGRGRRARHRGSRPVRADRRCPARHAGLGGDERGRRRAGGRLPTEGQPAERAGHGLRRSARHAARGRHRSCDHLRHGRHQHRCRPDRTGRDRAPRADRRRRHRRERALGRRRERGGRRRLGLPRRSRRAVRRSRERGREPRPRVLRTGRPADRHRREPAARQAPRRPGIASARPRCGPVRRRARGGERRQGDRRGPARVPRARRRAHGGGGPRGDGRAGVRSARLRARGLRRRGRPARMRGRRGPRHRARGIPPECRIRERRGCARRERAAGVHGFRRSPARRRA